MRRFVEWFERIVYITLIAFLVVLLTFTLLELGWLLVIGLFEDSIYRLESHELFNLFGYFLLILIGLELLETIKAYLSRREFHVEIIILVAIIAIARKVILISTATPGELIGIALIIIALCSGYYLVHRAGLPRSLPPEDPPSALESREEE
ncbi:MAG TPA: phosphate-starvation-inducible PsiE family protein [Methanoculleus sp.]|jgi:uncharacterized membrane protein (DUF373 family)|nr:phosphate-starvation-inducible PsiE family protein [Methanoculleus sp.]